MNETYSKLADIELLSTKDIEALKRIQQQVTKAVEPYNKQSLKIKHSLAPTLTQIAKIQEQYKELVRPVVSALNQQEEKLRPIISALTQQEEKLLPFYQTIANTLNDLDIAQNPAILQEPASHFFEQEFLEEIPITLNFLENEVSELSESNDLLEIIILLKKTFVKGSATIATFMIYYEFIKVVFGVSGIPFPFDDQQQVINIYGDINIQSETCNHADAMLEIIDQIANE